VVPGSKVADNRKNARNRNVSVNSANARNKAVVAVNKAVVAAKSVVAVNKAVVSKAADKPGCISLISGGRRLPPFLLDRFVAARRSG
jgi:hypothetical protein